MEILLQGFPRMLVYLDDILITGASAEEHASNLTQVLPRLQEAGLCLCKDKCEFMVPTVRYLGHVIDASGLHPFTDKLEAVRDAPIQKNTTDLKVQVYLKNRNFQLE